MAAINNLVIGLLRHAGYCNIAQARRLAHLRLHLLAASLLTCENPARFPTTSRQILEHADGVTLHPVMDLLLPAIRLL